MCTGFLKAFSSTFTPSTMSRTSALPSNIYQLCLQGQLKVQKKLMYLYVYMSIYFMSSLTSKANVWLSLDTFLSHYWNTSKLTILRSKWNELISISMCWVLSSWASDNTEVIDSLEIKALQVGCLVCYAPPKLGLCLINRAKCRTYFTAIKLWDLIFNCQG